MRPILIATLGLLALTGACADDAPGDDTSYNCADETRDDEFVVGLEKIGAQSALDFKLMTADPAPPSRGDNVWVLQVNAMSGAVVGAPVTGASINVTPFMPDHQHGTPTAAKIVEMGEAGQYQLSKVNMWMPGLWETTISVASTGGTDRVVYRFCIPN